jgi:hypothetical protein
LGRKRSKVLFPFSFSFSNSFQIKPFSTQIQIKYFQTFSQHLINLLDFTQATKDHALPNNDAQSLVVSRLMKLNN